MGALVSANFWSEIANGYGVLQYEGSLRYVLLDKQYQMQPLIRNRQVTFTDFLMSDPNAKKCKVIVNGNYYGLNTWGRIAAGRDVPDDPDDTEIQGQVLEGGKVIAGDSRPQSFWFAQMFVPFATYPWIFGASSGDPPNIASVKTAIGGAGPLIIDSLLYGAGNLYKPGAPKGVVEPQTGEPPPEAKQFLIQRNNANFVDANSRPLETGKTILAYCTLKRTLLIAVQEHGTGPGQSHATIADTLAKRGFNFAIFLDGSDSATLIVDGRIIISPGSRKNDTIDVGVGFRL